MKQACIRAMFSPTVLLACCACTFALDPSLDISQYAHTSWKVRDGFSKGIITSLAQTPDGYVWVGTESGLLRFDGVRPSLWQSPSGQQLPGTVITYLLATRDGTLWIGTFSGLASWKDGKLNLFHELAGQSITSLLETRDGTVWVGIYSDYGGGLCDIRSGVVHCDRDSSRFGTGVKALYEGSKGTLWVGLQNGLWRLKPGAPEFLSLPNEPFGITSFAAGETGDLLFGSHTGVRRIVGGKVEPYPSFGSEYRWQASRMFRDHDGSLWVGTSEHGLLHINEHGRTDVFSHVDGLSGDYVTCILEDREGSIWVATWDGIDRFRAYAIPSISTKEGLSSTVAWSVLGAKDGSVWISTSSALDHWKDGQITPFGSDGGKQKSEGKLNGEPPTALFQDSSGQIWVSTDHAFGYLRKDRFIPIGGVPGGTVYSITETSAGHVWFANQQAGLFHLRDGRLLEHIPWAGLGRKDFAKVIVADPSRRGLWLGFREGGVAYFADGRIRESYSAENGLGAGPVTDLRFGTRGALWATTGNGLSRIKDGHLITLTSKNGLPCDKVVASIEDNDQSVWLNLECGLVRITQEQLDAWVADPSSVLNVKLFDTSDGVRGHALSGAYQPLMTKTADGRIWFLPWDAVSVIDPHRIQFNKIPPPVHIEKITADDKSYDISNGLRLPPHVRDLSIEYTALSLVVPEKVRFRVKIEGQDREWRELTDRHVHYTNLQPKHYRFRVIACNNSGVWNEEGASLEFDIPPAWYQTLWFRGLCATALFGLLWTAYRLRVAQLEREERKLRETIETLPAMAWVTRPDGTNQFVNRRWLEYTGLSEKGAEGDSWKGLVHPEDVDRYVRRWLAVLAGGGTFEEEARVRAANGEYRWFLSRAVPLRNKRGKILSWYGVSTDIEDRKRAEQLQADLAHTNRITMLGELAASISHELKQPITATILSADTCISWLKREKPDLEEACETANNIRRAGMRATEIIDRLRALYKKTPSKRELVDVNEIISEMVVMLRGEANRFAVSIRTDLAVDLPKVTADRVQLQQVLMNLMLNGIEAMNETGGVLTIKSQPEDGHVLISVSDTGVGLPADNANKIFDAFYTTKPQGSGMGLAISRSIVESHGGRLWVRPNDGRGASFHLSLPTANAAAEVPPGAG